MFKLSYSVNQKIATQYEYRYVIAFVVELIELGNSGLAK
jgi:hypothetical protein